MKNKVSPEAAAQALKMAKGTQKVGQTKEQTKLITQGIEKGIAEYKKQQGKKLRELDKQRKQKVKQREIDSSAVVDESKTDSPLQILPWSLLVISWLGFIAFTLMQSSLFG